MEEANENSVLFGISWVDQDKGAERDQGNKR